MSEHSTTNNQPFDDYPLRPADFAATLGPTVVLIPHPDDEALGCGGLLALLRQTGQPVAAVLVSDGTMSHPQSRDFPPPARRELRYAELRHALAVLGADENAVLYLGLPDSQVPSEGADFETAADGLVDFLTQHRAETLLVPWRRDPHPDHRATAHLAAAALARLPAPAPRRLEYVVWAWERAAPADLPQPGEGTGFRLDISAVLPQKQRAIAAHRSQLAPGTITDDPSGFLLSEPMLAHFAQPFEVFIES